MWEGGGGPPRGGGGGGGGLYTHPPGAPPPPPTFLTAFGSQNPVGYKAALLLIWGTPSLVLATFI
ncbi:hypothetical protein QF016_005885 [Pseudomonas marginalis]|nr:hypothetical protein [Pseudomonas marginalis]